MHSINSQTYQKKGQPLSMKKHHMVKSFFSREVKSAFVSLYNQKKDYSFMSEKTTVCEICNMDESVCDCKAIFDFPKVFIPDLRLEIGNVYHYKGIDGSDQLIEVIDVKERNMATVRKL